MKKHMVIPIFVPHMGCPHDCIFCNQKKISGYQTSFNEQNVRDQIESYLSSSSHIKHIEIAFFGGSFTGISFEEQHDYLKLATEYIHKYHLEGIRLSTRPDMISTDILDLLKLYPVKTIELGVQSMSNEVLEASFRGHSSDDVINASKLIHSYGFNLGLQMMLGLPNDTIERSLKTASAIIHLNPAMVRIYPTLIIKETPLELLYQQNKYKPFSLQVTIDLCAKLLTRFESAGITVLRIGLQTTDSIQVDKDIVAGPYHPALRQLVTEKILLDRILESSKSIKEPILIEANSKLYQALIGHKKSHLPIFAHHVPVIQLKLNKDLPNHSIIKINGFYHKL